CHSCRGAELPGTKYKHAVAEPNSISKTHTYICTYCSNCHENFCKDRFCPVCLRTYRGESGEEGTDSDSDDNNMVCCDECNRWVHMECDGELTPEKVEEMGTDESLKYTCPLCASKVAMLRTSQMPPELDATESMQSLRGLQTPQRKVCGILARTTRIRGMFDHKGKRVGVPEIVGSGVEHDRKLVSDLIAQKNKHQRKRGRTVRTTSKKATTTASRRSPVRRASIASSTSSSLSSLSGSSVS
ncbi:hypothetical protein BGW38_008528, partial [Lunasporangiospora selenospora]